MPDPFWEPPYSNGSSPHGTYLAINGTVECSDKPLLAVNGTASSAAHIANNLNGAPSRLIELEVRCPANIDEVRAIFKAVYNVYVPKGFMLPIESEMRVSHYDLLPTTSRVFALQDGRIRSTATVYV